MPKPAEGLSAGQAAAIIKMVDTQTCDQVPLLDLIDFGAEPTKAAIAAQALTAALGRHPEFTLVSQGPATEFGRDGRGFANTYRADETGAPVTFTYHVAQRSVGWGMEDDVKLTGCPYVPDKVEVIDTRLDPGGKDAQITYRRTDHPSKLAFLLAGLPLNYELPPPLPAREHVAKLTRLDATGWRVASVDGASITYN